MKNAIFSALVVTTLTLLSGCSKSSNPVDTSVPDQTNGRTTIVNDETKLNLRLTESSDSIAVDSVAGLAKGMRTAKFSLKLVAQISPPLVNGQTIQATSVSLNGQYAYLSYNLRGNTYAGGIDIVQVGSATSTKIISHAAFNDTKVSSVYYDATTGNAYLAEASGNAAFASPAVVELIHTSSNKLVLSGSIQTVLTSYVATCAVVNNGSVYATTGSTGGLYKTTTDSLKITSYSALSDARWVDFDATYTAVVQGGGKLSVYNSSTGAFMSTYPFAGTSIPESKSTVRVIGGKALIAAGDGGVKLMNLATGKIVGSIPRTIVAGLDSSLSVTNAVDGSGQYIYISNGEAGVYVAQASQALENASGDAAITLKVLGKLRFAKLQSVNHVAYNGSTLVIASGLGGVKVVKVTF